MTPFTLFHALAGRLIEIEREVINYSAAMFALDFPDLGDRFRLESFYLRVSTASGDPIVKLGLLRCSRAKSVAQG
jgi:hypothetical protein